MRFVRGALFLGLFIMILVGTLFADVTISGLKVTNLQSKSATFTWFTNEPTATNKVYYRVSGGSDWTVVDETSNEGNAVNVHYIKLDYVLTAEVTYEYKVESNSVQSNVETFTTITAVNPTEFPKILTAKAQNEEGDGAIYAVIFAKLKKQGETDFEDYELSARVESVISGDGENTTGSYMFDISHFVKYPGYALSVGDEIHLFGYMSESTVAFDMIINDGSNVIIDDTPMIFNGIPDINNYNSFDEDGNGKIDKIELTFDKTLNAAIVPDIAAFTVTTVDAKRNIPITAVNIVDQKLILTIEPDFNYTGKVQLTYNSALTENDLQDMEGVLVEDITELLLLDKASPVIVEFEIMDLYDNSSISDYALVKYSEKITGLSVTNPNNYSFTVSDVSQEITSIVMEDDLFARINFTGLHYGNEVSVIISNIIDDSNNTMAQYTNTVIVPSNDDIAPVLSFLTEIPAVITENNSIDIQGDFVEQTEITKMEYRLIESGVKTGWTEFTTYSNDTNVWMLSLSGLSEGNVSLYIKATDYNGNVSSNLTADFRVNNNSPSIENPNVTLTDTELQFSFDITDEGGTIDYTISPDVIITNGVEQYSLEQISYADNSWNGSIALEGLNDGVYDLILNGVTDTDSLYVNEYTMEDIYTKDTTAPTIEFYTTEGNVFNSTDVAITGAITDAISDITLVEYQLNDGEWQNLSDFANFTINLTDLEAGNYILTLRAEDFYENTSESLLTFVIDLEAPVVTINPISTYLNETSLTVSGTINDPAKSNITEVKYQLDDEEWVVMETGYTNTTFEFLLNELLESSHTIKVQAKDEGDHLSNIATADFIVDTTIPTVVIETTPDYVTTLPFTVSGSIANAKDRGVAFVYYNIDSGDWNEVSDFTDTSFEFTLSTLDEGSHNVSVKVIDEAGNESDIVEWDFVCDITLPIADDFVAQQHTDFSGGAVISVEMQISDEISGIDYTVMPQMTIKIDTGSPIVAEIESFENGLLRGVITTTFNPEISDVTFSIIGLMDIAGNELDFEATIATVSIDENIDYGYTIYNSPNPFNPETSIRYSLAKDSNVKIDIYNAKGELVKSLVQGRKNRGEYSITWDGKNNQGKKVSSGIYFYILNAEGHCKKGKMLMLK